MDYTAIRKASLKVFIGFLALTALIAIISVLSGEFGKIQFKVLATTFSISAASICSMSCAAFMEKRKRTGLGLTGILLCAVGAVLVIVGLWPEIDSEVYWKTTVTVIVAAIALAHAFLLSLPDLDDRHTWIQWLSSGSIGLLALQIVTAVWAEIDNEVYYRFLAVVAILLALETLVIPILMKLKRGPVKVGQRLTLEQVDSDLYQDMTGKQYHVTEVLSEPVVPRAGGPDQEG